MRCMRSGDSRLDAVCFEAWRAEIFGSLSPLAEKFRRSGEHL